MGKTNLGRVAFVPCGAYSDKIAYKRLDVVEREGSSYLFLKDSTGIAPTGDGEVTMFLAKKGKDFTYDDFSPEQLAALKGGKGDKGDPGKGFTILGYYGTLDLLKASVTTPEAGDAYGIGTEAPYNIYVYDGVTNDWVDNGKLSGGGGDPFQLGEFRYSSRIDNPFGENYVLCAGQEVSLEEYPNAGNILPFVMSEPINISYPIIESPRGDFGHAFVKGFNGDTLLGMVSAIPTPDGGLDYTTISICLYKYNRGNWDYLCDLPKQENEFFIPFGFFNVNKKLVFSVSGASDITATNPFEKLYVTSDSEYKKWEIIEMVVPNGAPDEYDVVSMAYGQNVYVAILKGHNPDGKCLISFVKSTDMIHWTNIDTALPDWTESDYDITELSVTFKDNTWVLQFNGVVRIGEDINVDSPLTSFAQITFASGHSIDEAIRDIRHLTIVHIEIVLCVTDNNIYSLQRGAGTNSNYEVTKINKPTGFDADETILYTNFNGDVVGSKGHYRSGFNGEVGKINIPSNWTGDIIKAKTAFIFADNNQSKEMLEAKINAIAPQMVDGNSGMCFYIKLK